MDLDPEESIMTMKLATLVANNINYDKYYTPGDFSQVSKFWGNIGLLIGISKYIKPRCFVYGNFEYDPYRELFDLFEVLQKESPAKFFELLQELIKSLNIEKIIKDDSQAVQRLNRYLSALRWIIIRICIESQ